MVVLMFSGGFDSTVLFYDLMTRNKKFICAFVDYGQKNAVQELKVVKDLCDDYRIPLKVFHAEHIFDHVPSTLLAINKGQHTVKSDEIPNRNATLACIVASSLPYKATIMFGAHRTSSDYADAKPQFYTRLSKLLMWSTNNLVECCAPYIRLTKKQIVRLAWQELAITPAEISKSLSCYEGNNCGKCPACLERKRALEDSPYDNTNV